MPSPVCVPGVPQGSAMFGMTAVGLTILSVGWEWPILGTAGQGLSVLTFP